MALGCAVAITRQSTLLSQMHSDFVADVSHQLKTPLALLTTASDTLSLGRVRSPEKLKEYAEIVHGQTERLSRLVEQILAFSRHETGPNIYHFQKIDLAQFVKQSVEGFDVGTRRGEVTIQFEAPPEAVFVEADPAALEDVVSNLLDNAVKYGNGRNQVVVRVEHAARQAVLSVRDQGIGIEPADLSRIFNKFYRGRQDGHPQRGFGLGLTIVRDVVRAHRGRITVESERGCGSDFRVALPSA
jgi:two-component system phosphate regulon sensor histidine kinase PhoR